ncbi:Maf family nucleotide pyrophosphatase [Taibaiella koreensis]|uniref:Maf family nucleotide pyrophosphatase n=1 Tax=Taibaiella koreensis TaxID=1268548 RepID=UPI001968F81E|nr:Maf family nucleotide pyrophosphatase [Taibaiella koreensis]
MKKIILASQSPRRKQLLEQAELSFEIRTAHANEEFPDTIEAAQVPLFIAGNKARAVWDALPETERSQTIIIAADTVVVLDNRIIGKPVDEADACAILRSLSGRTHKVITGVVILSDGQEETLQEITEVDFLPLSEEQITHYVSHYQPMDKAGAYAIQEWIGLVGIRRIAGDFYNVMGLPVNRVLQTLKRLS